MTEFGFPYRIGADGRTMGASREQHVRSLIELVLFTAQGERVNRPDFGAGLRQLVFSENAPELAASAQHLVQSALQRYLADVIEVRSVDVQARGSMLSITVSYRPFDEGREQVVRFESEV